jgi:TPR repeat protein
MPFTAKPASLRRSVPTSLRSCPRGARWLFAAAASWMLIALPQAAVASPPAAALAQDGVSAYEAGRLDEAAGLFERAARAGNRLAQFNYAMMLYRGETASAKDDPSLGWRWLRRAAGAGLAQAQFSFARL